MATKIVDSFVSRDSDTGLKWLIARWSDGSVTLQSPNPAPAIYFAGPELPEAAGNLANLVWNSMIDRDRRRYYSVAIPNQPTPDGWRTLGAFPTQTEAHEYARRTYPRVMNYQVVGYIGL